MIIEDLQAEVANGKKAEAKTQMDFAEALKAAKTLKSELIDKKDELSDIIAQTNVEKTDEEDDKKKNAGDLKDEDDYKAEITPDCDWILGAFTARADARAKELQGLTTAKEYLNGAKGASLVSTGSKFDDNALSKNSFLR